MVLAKNRENRAGAFGHVLGCLSTMNSTPNSRVALVDPQSLAQQLHDAYQFIGEQSSGSIVQQNNSNIPFDEHQSMPQILPATIPEAPLPGVGLAFIVTKADQQDPGSGTDQYTFTTNVNQAVHPSVDDLNNSVPDGKSSSFPRRPKTGPKDLSPPDPHASAFLEQRLGPEKWERFSAKLFEKRMTGPKAPPPPTRSKKVDPRDSGRNTASAVEFLIKVEIVKEVLRSYVPHPYNPLKSLTHPFDAAPNGAVTLTRATVLLLCGWSNTQFSYWARRSEALSVLAPYDHRLRAIALALEHRLRGGEPPCYSPSSLQANTIHHRDSESASANEPAIEEFVTGKGLDSIIEEVKKRSGVSQFLRGKHSSLDPFVLPPFDPLPVFPTPSSEHNPTAVSVPIDGPNEDLPSQEVSPSQPAALEFIAYMGPSHPLLDMGSNTPSPPSDLNNFSIPMYSTPSYVNHDLGGSGSVVPSVPSHPISIAFQPSRFPEFYIPHTHHQPQPSSLHSHHPQLQHSSSGSYIPLPLSTGIPSHILEADAASQHALPPYLSSTQNPLTLVAAEDSLLVGPPHTHMAIPSSVTTTLGSAAKNKIRESEGTRDSIVGIVGGGSRVLHPTRSSNKRPKIQP